MEWMRSSAIGEREDGADCGEWADACGDDGKARFGECVPAPPPGARGGREMVGGPPLPDALPLPLPTVGGGFRVRDDVDGDAWDADVCGGGLLGEP